MSLFHILFFRFHKWFLEAQELDMTEWLTFERLKPFCLLIIYILPVSKRDMSCHSKLNQWVWLVMRILDVILLISFSRISLDRFARNLIQEATKKPLLENKCLSEFQNISYSDFPVDYLWTPKWKVYILFENLLLLSFSIFVSILLGVGYEQSDASI